MPCVNKRYVPSAVVFQRHTHEMTQSIGMLKYELLRSGSFLVERISSGPVERLLP